METLPQLVRIGRRIDLLRIRTEAEHPRITASSAAPTWGAGMGFEGGGGSGSGSASGSGEFAP